MLLVVVVGYSHQRARSILLHLLAHHAHHFNVLGGGEPRAKLLRSSGSVGRPRHPVASPQSRAYASGVQSAALPPDGNDRVAFIVLFGDSGAECAF